MQARFAPLSPRGREAGREGAERANKLTLLRTHPLPYLSPVKGEGKSANVGTPGKNSQ